MNGLQIAYAANLAILLPIAVPTILRSYRTDQGCFAESAGWRVLVGSLWTAIMILSALGLREPLRFSPVLLLQVIYKTLWLLFYVVPLLRKGEWSAIPAGITTSFAAIVLVWPWLIPWRYLCQ
jgi:hypothetical protein